MADFNAGSIQASLTLDRTAFDAGLREAQRQVAQLESGRHDVNIGADTGAATAKIDALKARIATISGKTVTIGVRVIGFGAIGAALGSLGPEIAGVGGLASTVGAGLGAFATAAVGDFKNMTKSMSDVTKAQQAVQSASNSAARSGTNNANQIKAAQLSLRDTELRVANDRIEAAERVKNAQQAVKDAQDQMAQDEIEQAQNVASAEQNLASARQQANQKIAQANQQVVTAEQAVTTAQQNALAAQKALTDAREAGARALQDSAFAVADANLALQQDQISLTEAQQNYQKVNANAASTDLQRKEAALQLAEAQQRLTEQQVTLQRATEDNNKAQAGGVNGTPQVVSAQNQVTAAHNQQVQAQKNLQDAIQNRQQVAVSAAQSIQKAEQELADAERKQATTRQRDLQAISKAQQNLADAQRAQTLQATTDADELSRAQLALADAQKSSAGGSAGLATALGNLQKAEAGITPPMQRAIAAFNDMKTAYKNLQDATAPAVFGTFTQAFQIAAQLLPKLAPLINTTAGAIGQSLQRIGDALNGPGFQKFLDFVNSNIGPILQGLTGGFLGFASGFATMVEKVSPLSAVMVQQIQALGQGWKNVANSGGFSQFVQEAVPVMQQFSSTIGSLLKDIGSIVLSLMPAMKPALQIISELGNGISQIVGALAGPLAQLLQGLVPIIPQLIPPLTQLATALGPAIVAVFAALGPMLPPIVQAFVSLVTPIANFVASLSPGQLQAIIITVGSLVGVFKGFEIIKGQITNVKGLIGAFKETKDIIPLIKGLSASLDVGPLAIVTVIATVAMLVIQHWAAIKGAFEDAISWIEKVFQPTWQFVKDYIVNPIVDAYNAVVHWFESMIHWITGTLWPFLKTWGPVALALLDPFIGIPLIIFQHWKQIIGFLESIWNTVSQWFVKTWDGFVRWVSDIWASIVGHVKSAWNGITNWFANSLWAPISSWFSNTWNGFVTWTGKIWGNIVGAVKGAWNGVANWFGSIWYDVEKTFADAYNWIVKHILQPFANVINKVLGAFGIKITVPTITISAPSNSSGNAGQSFSNGGAGGHRLARGGVIPGYDPGHDTVPAMLSPGEGVLTPQAVRGLGGAQAIYQLNAMFGNAQHFLFGGIVGDITHGIEQGWDLAKSVGSDIGSLAGDSLDAIRGFIADGVIEAFKALEAPIKAALGLAPGDFAKNLATGVFNKVNSAVFDFISGHASGAAGDLKKKAQSTVAGASVPSADHAALITRALILSGVPVTAANIAAVNTIIQHESGWNAGAVNNWDSNAARGTPSEGLMQTIGPTFQAYHIPMLGDNIFDPIENIVAGVRYAISRYGSLLDVPGVWNLAHGGHYVGYDGGGILAPGYTLAANKTGKNEVVLTPDQAKALGGPISIRVFIGDRELTNIVRTEVDNGFEDALVNFRAGAR